jgi:RNA:NAD 2'-phosphotransferase (TPT1/KptA family)
MEDFSKQTSKLISYWLRHSPEEAGLTVDESGWTSVDQLLAALNARNLTMNVQNLRELAEGFDKVRWEFDPTTTKIRATHGHSFPVLLDDKAKNPPEELYHGTSFTSIKDIAATGLKSMDRHLVHLSSNLKTALSVGSRHGKPIIISIQTERLVKDGWRFYQTSDNVWLTSDIPVKYLDFEPWFPLEASGNSLLKELKREIGLRFFHHLYFRLPGLKAVWQSGASDDVLFQDVETGQCFVVHLTYTRRYQERKGWPCVEIFNNIEDWFENGLWRDQQYFYHLL